MASVAKAMQLLKGNSSKWIGETFPKMHAFAWQEGYGAFSVGVSGVDATVALFRNCNWNLCGKSFMDPIGLFTKSSTIPTQCLSFGYGTPHVENRKSAHDG